MASATGEGADFHPMQHSLPAVVVLTVAMASGFVFMQRVVGVTLTSHVVGRELAGQVCR